NLMTHQREVVVAVRAREDGQYRFANTDPDFAPVLVTQDELHPPADGDWRRFIASAQVTKETEIDRGAWGHYLKGALLRVGMEEQLPKGLDAVVGSDLPRGAALSSSAALCTALVQALLGLQGRGWPAERLILAARDAEWYTGSRCGTSDQAAIVLGGCNEVVNVALLAEDFSLAGLRRDPFPEDWALLVVNSYTRRSISGAERLAYTRNRFAYTLALEIFRQTLQQEGRSAAEAAAFDRLSRITPEALGGDESLYRLLLRIPESLPLADLQQRYDLPKLQVDYEAYFGGIPDAERPTTLPLRGPLLFGIAESDRAIRFSQALEHEDLQEAGRLMTIGHDGDRVANADGTQHLRNHDDDCLRDLLRSGTPLRYCPGDYGARTRVLDALVDTALGAGASGACLTGAGLAGVVLALCAKEDAARIAETLRHRMAKPDYARLAERAPLTEKELKEAVIINRAPAGAGELAW
ncbi:MAG: hypothetical protein IT368_04180, partial [Candidatus Hydrogenedentes bacterium]|nr:hypothetical protein [Candidatus Hydrogenedentota bacterium]